VARSQNVVTPLRPRRRRFGWFRRRVRDLGPPPKYWQTHLWPRGRRPHRVFLVHGKCADGLTSAGLLLHRWPDGMVLYAQPAELLQRLRYGLQYPPWLELVIADVAPQTHEADETLRVLKDLRTHCRITWIDHHAPQWTAEFEQRLKEAGVDVVVDRTGQESGASLVAKWAHIKDERLLDVADMVRRRDAWTDPHNPRARAWVSVAGALRREYVDRLADVRLEGLEDEGTKLVNLKDQRVAEILRTRVRRHSDLVRWQWGSDDVSDVADRLFQTDREASVFLRFGKTGNVSIRSRHDRPVAAEIAQAFGGGGHANAAGFNLPLHFWARIAYRILRGRDAAGRAVRRRAQTHAENATPAPKSFRKPAVPPTSS
jgi:oligoribonuclease NrnB/cAMP/cGMP phosphodiesterase (DHH superfamily)